MEESCSRAALPSTYALALWLRDIGCSHEETASVLDVELESVGPLLRLAELKSARMALPSVDPTRCHSPGVLLFVDEATPAVVDDAVALALVRGETLHLVATYASPSLEIDGEPFAEDPKRNAEARVLRAAGRALRGGADVAPLVVLGGHEVAVQKIVQTWGPVTVVPMTVEA